MIQGWYLLIIQANLKIIIHKVWSLTLKRKQYLKVDGDGASAEISENMGSVV